MPAYARKDIVREGEVATYHCWSRCVQQAFLCGYDPETGRISTIAAAGSKICWPIRPACLPWMWATSIVLSNHAHTILRTRPDIAATWSAEELALRWKMAWPEFRRRPVDPGTDRSRKSTPCWACRKNSNRSAQPEFPLLVHGAVEGADRQTLQCGDGPHRSFLGSTLRQS